MTLILHYKSSFCVRTVEKVVCTWFEVGWGNGNHNLFTLFLLSLKKYGQCGKYENNLNRLYL